MNKRLLTLIMISSLAACAPKGVKDDAGEAAAGNDNNATDASVSTGAKVGAIGDAGIGDGMTLEGTEYSISYEKAAINDPGNILSNKTIYFDYDSSDIKPEYEELVKHHGKYLALHSDVNIRLEGHTDERGTREYNIALADRRAQSVKRLLTFQGANSGQITIISYGEEKPAVLGQGEEAWSQNRRAIIEYRN